MKLYPLPAAQLTAWAAVPSLDHAVTLLGLAHKHLGSGLTGFEVMGQFALSLVGKHFPQLRVPFIDDAARPTACCWKTPTTNPKTTRARASRRCSKAAFEDGCVTRRGGGREPRRRRTSCGTCAKAFRSRRPRKASTSSTTSRSPVSRILPSCAATDALLRQDDSRRAAGELRLTWATATCTTTCRRRRAVDNGGRSCASTEDLHEHAGRTTRWRGSAARSRPSTAWAR